MLLYRRDNPNWIAHAIFLQPGDPKPKTPLPGAVSPAANNSSAGLGVGLYAVVLLGGLVAFGAYQYLQQQQNQQA